MNKAVVVLALAISCGVGLSALSDMSEEAEGTLTFELYNDARQEYRWRLKASNGRLIAMSDEGYQTKASCRNGIELIRSGAASATVEDLTQENE